MTEPAADLGIAIAAASSYMERPVRGDVLVLGEVGLAGEVRAVAQMEPRLAEAGKMGFVRAVLPKGSARRVESRGVKLLPVETLGEALEALFPRD